jgi:sortase A
MRDKRPVDELSIEELERILAIRKREERQKHMSRMQRSGRVIGKPNAASSDSPPLNGAPPATSLPAETVTLPPSAVSQRRDLAPTFEDDPRDVEAMQSSEKDRIWRAFVNRALLLVEVAAVAGLVYIGANLFSAMTALQRETASAQQQANLLRQTSIPTLAPTPQIRLDQLVLPGGHTPPTAPGGGQFNFNEIPAVYQPLVQSQILQPPIVRPTPAPETAMNLIIPKLNVDQAIVQGVDWEALKQGVGQLSNGATPGDDVGNVVLAAHNDIYGETFRYLDKLQQGDQFQIQTQTQTYTYVVTKRDIVEPTDVQVMETHGGATATLISCYPYQVDSKRIVVFADRVD